MGVEPILPGNKKPNPVLPLKSTTKSGLLNCCENITNVLNGGYLSKQVLSSKCLHEILTTPAYRAQVKVCSMQRDSGWTLPSLLVK